MTFDAEQLLDTLFAIMKSELNTRIAKIQAEKTILLGDANFDLKTIDDEAWFDSLDERTVNFDPFVYYGIQDDTIIEIASAESSDLTLFFLVVAANDNTAVMPRKMLRYIRALKEIATRHFADIPEASNLKVVTVQPRDLKDLEAETFHKIGGIAIQAAIS